jgi:uncharacterized protein
MPSCKVGGFNRLVRERVQTELPRMPMLEADKVYLGTSAKPEYIRLDLANRHGLVTGATGTGKTVSLQVMAQGFSDAGVPVFCADIKGDLSGIAMPGEPKEFLMKRAEQIGFADEYKFSACPVIFWDLFGKAGQVCCCSI